MPGLRRGAVFNGVRTSSLAGDLTSGRCKGKLLPLGMTVDHLTGQVLTIDALSGEDVATLQAWMTPIAEQVGRGYSSRMMLIASSRWPLN